MTEQYVVTVGHFPDASGAARYPFMVTMRWDGTKLAISGDCQHSGGQISELLVHPSLMPAPGWDAAKLARLRELWERWHLNSLRAGCEHQRAAGWGAREVTARQYALTPTAATQRRQLSDAILDAAKRGAPVELTDDERALLAIDHMFTLYGDDAPPDAAAPFVALRRESVVRATHVLHSESAAHGLLCKPCPVCGYKYGSVWLTEALPGAVLDELRALFA